MGSSICPFIQLKRVVAPLAACAWKINDGKTITGDIGAIKESQGFPKGHFKAPGG